MFKGEDGHHVVLENTQAVLRTLEERGSGGFGHVDIVWSTLSLPVYARKRFLRGASARETKAKFEFFEREIGALKKLHHKHLVKIRGTYTDTRCFGFLMDPVAECDFESYLERMRPDRVPTLRSFFGCLASALTYLHGQKIHHMDIKPKNILIRRTCVYLADFGAAHDWSARDRSTTWSSQPHTTFYMPPERDLDPHARVNYASDIWSLGVVSLEMLTVLRGVRIGDFREHLRRKGTPHQHPHKNIIGANLWLEFLRQRPGPEYDNIPQTWIKDMLMKDSTRRPYAKQLRSEILQAGYFSGFCCGSVEEMRDIDETSDLEEDPHNIDYWDQYDNLDSNVVPDATPLDPMKSQSIQSWINRTDVVGQDRTKSTKERQTISFQVHDDEEGTIIPSTSDEDDSKPSLKEISDFDFTAGFGNSGLVPPNHDLKFDIDQDDTDTDGSEITLKLHDSNVEQGVEIVQQDIDEGYCSPDLFAPLPSIEEECVSDEVGTSPWAKMKNAYLQEPIVKSNPVAQDAIKNPVDHQSLNRPSVDFDPETNISSADELQNDLPWPARRASLTYENLESLSSLLAPSKKDRSSLKPHLRRHQTSRVSARKYIRQVSVETDSEATSVMSEGTRRKIQRLGISVWMNKSMPLLENYVRLGKVAAVRALLEAGCKPNGKGLLLAAIKGRSMRHVKCADALLKKGADVNIRSSGTGKSLLSTAIEHQYYDGDKLLILILLKFGADPNVKDRNGDSPVLQILYGYEPLEDHRRDALALIFANSKYPVDVNVMPIGTLNTPLHLAVRRKDPYATAMLLANGADIFVRNGAGQTAFAIAATGWSSRMANGQTEVARLLIRGGADVDELLRPSTSAALHVAVGYGLVDVVYMLTRAGANLSVANDMGQTAFQVCTNALAQGKINEQIAEQITSHLMSRDWASSVSDTESSSSEKDSVSIGADALARQRSNKENTQLITSWLTAYNKSSFSSNTNP